MADFRFFESTFSTGMLSENDATQWFEPLLQFFTFGIKQINTKDGNFYLFRILA